ncbi:MAG: cupin domain-containing protein, partial [Flavisolibacter sp.]
MPFIELGSLSKKTIIKGYEARAVHTGTITLMYWTVEAGAAMPIHTHPHEQVAHVLEGKFEMILNGEIKILEPGHVAVIPPHQPHGG